MNILLINHYAGSRIHGMEYRPYYLAREWVRMGHQVTILAASFSHVRTHNPKIDQTVTEEEIDGIRYIWLKTPPYHGNGVRRAMNIFAFVNRFYAWQGRLFYYTPLDVIIASSTYPLDVFPAHHLAQKVRARLIFEVHDLWPLSLIELGHMSPLHPLIMLMQWAENFAYRHAERVVSMLPKAIDHMVEHGMDPGKFVYIPNGIDVEEWENDTGQIPDEHRTVLTSLKRAGKFMVGYAGAHGLANGLDSLVEAAARIVSEEVAFVLVGQGPQKEDLREKASQHQLTNIVFLPPITRESIPALLNYLDALYIGLKKEPLFRFGVSPNKLMDYMMAAKPIIYAIEAGNDPVAESGCGISIPPENPDAVVEAVTRLMKISESERAKMGSKGRDYVMANNDYRVLARTFLDAISKEHRSKGAVSESANA